MVLHFLIPTQLLYSYCLENYFVQTPEELRDFMSSFFFCDIDILNNSSFNCSLYIV